MIKPNHELIVFRDRFLPNTPIDSKIIFARLLEELNKLKQQERNTKEG